VKGDLTDDEELCCDVGRRKAHPSVGVLECAKANDAIDELLRAARVILGPNPQENRPAPADLSDNASLDENPRFGDSLANGAHRLCDVAGLCHSLFAVEEAGAAVVDGELSVEELDELLESDFSDFSDFSVFDVDLVSDVSPSSEDERPSAVLPAPPLRWSVL
jgi:hypothetical protein